MFPIFCHKICELFQTLIGAWLAQPLKQFQPKPPRVTKFDLHGTLELHFSNELVFRLVMYSLFSWVLSLMNKLSFTCFLDLLMAFQFHWVHRGWYKVANNTTTWPTLEIVLVFIMLKWHRCSHHNKSWGRHCLFIRTINGDLEWIYIKP